MSYVLVCDRCAAVCVWDVPRADRLALCDPCAGRPPRTAPGPVRPRRPRPGDDRPLHRFRAA